MPEEPRHFSSSDIMAITPQQSVELDGDTPEKTAIDIYNSLRINHGTQILLSIAWCTNKQRRFLALFPESTSSDIVLLTIIFELFIYLSTSSDVIFKINNEKRPSFHICSKTSMNETFGGMYSFLASQAKWSFDHAWSIMVPAIVDPRFIVRNKQMATDNDDKLHGPYEKQVPSRYENGKHRLCCFHSITQGWPKNNITNNRVKQGPESYIGDAILEAIKRIVISWTNDIESPEELKVSYNILMALLNDKEYMKYFDESFPNDVITFVVKKVWIYRDKLVHYNFMKTRSFGTRTSNSSEIEGGVLKHHTAGPKPNHSMATAADATNKVSDMRIVLKEQKAAKAMDTLPTEVEEELVPLYENLTVYCSDKLASNWRRRRYKTVFRAGPNVFWVKAKTFSKYSSNPSNLDEFLKYLSVQFERTRVVEIFRVEDKLFLKCSCCEYEQHGYMCGDICAVVDEAPNPQDVVIRWHKPYYVMYLNGNPALDRMFDKLVENESPGPLVPAASVEMFRTDLSVGECTTEHTKEYFESSLPSQKPKLHPGTKWATMGSHALNAASPTDETGNKVMAGIQTVVALSQTAAESNQAYLAFSREEDNEFPVADNEDTEEEETNKMDESMDTYGSKSPERSLARGTTQSMSAMSVCKAKFEATCNAVGTDSELTKELYEVLSGIHVKAMAKHQSKRMNQGTTQGMQSFPAMDTARKSIRIEACPTGNNAAGKAKKRVAKKQPPLGQK